MKTIDAAESKEQCLELLERESWSMTTIVPWELANLVQPSRFDIGDWDVVHTLNALPVWPVDLAVARALTRLDFRSDSVDEIIAATSVVRGVPLLTSDQVILGSAAVPVAR